MAKNWSDLQAFADVLREAFKLPCRNKQTLLFIFLSTITLYFLVLAANIASLIPLFDRMSREGIAIVSMDFTSTEYQGQVAKIEHVSMLLVLVEIIYVVLLFLVAVASMVSTIYLSSVSYLERDLTIKELCSKVKEIWIRPLITWFYIFLFSMGFLYLICCLILLVYLARGSMSIVVATVGSVLLLVTGFLNLYFSLVWMVSLVTSTLEDCYGFEAIAKAAKLVEGRKVVGLLLTFILAILSSGISLVIFLANSKNHQTAATMLLMMGVALVPATMVKILSMMVYTVFHFKCKESQGEQVYIEKEIGYRKVSTVALSLP